MLLLWSGFLSKKDVFLLGALLLVVMSCLVVAREGVAVWVQKQKKTYGRLLILG